MSAPTQSNHRDLRETVAKYDSIYEDTGCHLFPSCLSCPKAVCIEDEREERHPNGRTLIAAKLPIGLRVVADVGGRVW